jgi:hypothetical protein
VIVAEWIATELGFGLDGEAHLARPETELRLLGIDDAAIHAVANDAQKLARSLG